MESFYNWFMSRPGKPDDNDNRPDVWSRIMKWNYIKERFHYKSPNVKGGNYAEIEIKRNYNGSGKNCFGGAKEWMAVTVLVSAPLEMERSVAETLLHDIRLALQKAGYNPEK